jgi:hypothetical protein
VKLISNAGGVNPHACAAAARKATAEAGLALKIAVVSGKANKREREFDESKT